LHEFYRAGGVALYEQEIEGVSEDPLQGISFVNERGLSEPPTPEVRL